MFELCKIKYLSNNVGSFTSSLMHEYLCANVFTRVLLLLGTIWFVCVYEEKGDIMMAVEILYTTRYYYTKVCRYVLLMMVPILP